MGDTPIITSKDLTKEGAGMAADAAISGARTLIPMIPLIGGAAHLPVVRKWLDAGEAEMRKLAAKGTDQVAAEAESSGLFQKSDGWLVELGNWLKEQCSGLKDILLAWIDEPSVSSRNTLLSSIGVDSKGASTGPNPFAGLGSIAGIVQASTADQIQNFAGFTGMPKERKEAIGEALAAYKAIALDTYNALGKKLGLTEATKPGIELAAKQAASVATGIDTKIAEASNAAEQLDKNLPNKGLIASFVQAASTSAHTVTAIAFDTNAIKQTTTMLAAIGKPQPPSAEALAAAKNAGKDQKLAAADTGQPDGPGTVPGTAADKPKGKA